MNLKYMKRFWTDYQDLDMSTVVEWVQGLGINAEDEQPGNGDGSTVLKAAADAYNSQTLYLWEEGNVPEGTEVKGAVLICAGGAFQFRSDQNEGTPVAEELSRLGYQRFMVRLKIPTTMKNLSARYGKESKFEPGTDYRSVMPQFTSEAVERLYSCNAVMFPISADKFQCHAPAFCGAGNRLVLPAVPWTAFQISCLCHCGGLYPVVVSRSLCWIVLYDRDYKTLAKVDSYLEDLDRLKAYLASYGVKM